MTIGDFDLAAIIHRKFTTRQFSTGAPIVLVSGVISVYKDASLTQSVAGVTLTPNFDGVVGLNHVQIDTSADGTFYSAGSFFDIVLTAGTADGISVTGETIDAFTIRKNSALKPATAGRLLVVDAAGLADANMVKAGPTGAGTAQTARDIGFSVSGYENGFVWFDTAGAAGTVNFVNGTVLNPNSSIANCRTIANALNLKRFYVIGGSTVTLDQGYSGFVFSGTKWTLALANRLITDSFFEGATVSGTATGTGVRFSSCSIGNVTVDPCLMDNCVLIGTITLGTGGNYQIVASVNGVATGSDCFVDFATAGTNTVAMRDFAGSVQVLNMAAGDVFGMTGNGKVTIAASCTGGTVQIAGNVNLVNSGTGMTIVDTSRWNEDQSMANVTTVGTVTALSTSAINAVADQVWDELLAGHVIVGSAGAALAAAGSSGDPWATLLPGAYGAGTAGNIVGVNLNATVSSRLPTSSYVSPPSAVTISETLLDSNLATGPDTVSRSVRNALRPLRNRVDVTTGSTYKEDDIVVAWTFTTTTNAGALPITEINPS